MTKTLVSQPVAPSQGQNPDLPPDPVALTPEEIPESASTTATMSPAMFDPDDNRYYVHHWGINE